MLDLGTGTGIWAIDFARRNPTSQVIGVDISVLQPEFVSKNLQFQIDDVEEEWTWRQDFDLIHCRMLDGCFKDMKSIFRKAFKYVTRHISNCSTDAVYYNRQLRPGGYFEVGDVLYIPQCDDGTLLPNSPIRQWGHLLAEAANNMGRPINLASQYRDMLIDVGFEDVCKKSVTWPTNPWARQHQYRRLGAWTQLTLCSELEALSMALFTHGLGWKRREILALCGRVRKEMENPEIHAYFCFVTCYGRKPVATVL